LAKIKVSLAMLSKAVYLETSENYSYISILLMI